MLYRLVDWEQQAMPYRRVVGDTILVYVSVLYDVRITTKAPNNAFLRTHPCVRQHVTVSYTGVRPKEEVVGGVCVLRLSSADAPCRQSRSNSTILDTAPTYNNQGFVKLAVSASA